MGRAPVLAKYDDDEMRMRVLGGLHYIKGNQRPHFSLTASGFDKRQRSEFGGCCHDEILSLFPQFADLAALHMSDIDGVPMHVLENGFYSLGGTHWRGPHYKMAAKHFRITEDEARTLPRSYFGDDFSETDGFLGTGYAERAKVRLAEWIETQKPRWKQEAETCIIAHNLVVYGDPWP